MATAARSLRILHFAFEEHRQPHRGGGALRTLEINRRLARRHQLTVVTRRYRGAKRRIEDGIEYRHLGLSDRLVGRWLSMVTYHLSVPIFARYHRADLVVEDFAAPMSSVSLPLFTSDPTIAVVQWLFAEETSRRYRLPFYYAERLGLRTHTNFVVVSKYIGERVRRAHPGADVRVVENGIDSRLGSVGTVTRNGRDLLYLGRLQMREKGLDLLIESFAHLASKDEGVRLVIAGDGPSKGALKAVVDRRGLGDRVHFAGRVDGEEKEQLLLRAALVVIPSRFESFGIVAAEALAAGTPVVAFRLPVFEEILDSSHSVLVEPFDTKAFAEQCLELLDDPAHRRSMSSAGMSVARRFDWNRAALLQEEAYLHAVASHLGGDHRHLTGSVRS